MEKTLKRRSIALVGAVCLALAIVAVLLDLGSSPTSSANRHLSSPSVQAASSRTAVVQPPTPSTTAPVSRVTVPSITAKAYGDSVILDLAAKVTGLAQRQSNAGLVNGTQFDVTLKGVSIPATRAGSILTRGDATISAVIAIRSGSTTEVEVTLAKPATADQVAVGAGQMLQVKFS